MNNSTFKFPKILASFKPVILFAIILMGSNLFWKYTVLGDETDTMVSFFGLNISPPFIWFSDHVASVTQMLLRFFGTEVTLEKSNSIRFTNLNAVQIIWACTGLKQAYIFTCIIAFYRGPWIHKLWFIPLGLVIVNIFNIFRITFITATFEHHPEWFVFLHETFFKYLFYVVIFGMWVIWVEKFAGKTAAEEKVLPKTEKI